jgi:hypothetical protein
MLEEALYFNAEDLDDIDRRVEPPQHCSDHRVPAGTAEAMCSRTMDFVWGLVQSRMSASIAFAWAGSAIIAARSRRAGPWLRGMALRDSQGWVGQLPPDAGAHRAHAASLRTTSSAPS